MEIDLNENISLRIAGEDEKNQSIDVEKFYKLYKNFQELINCVAMNDIAIEGGINIQNFKVELCGFHGGSAITDFRYTNNIIPTVADYKEQRQLVNKSINELMLLSSNGNYEALTTKYPDARRRNTITESLYNFRNSVGKSELEIGYYDDDFKPTYKLKEFKPAVKDKLMVVLETVPKPIKNEYEAFGKVKITQKGKTKTVKLEEELGFDNHSMTYSPEVIIYKNMQYILKYPLHCTFTKEDGCYRIKNDMLDIVAIEETKDEAEASFNEQFDYLYNRINDAPYESLGKKMKEIKVMFPFILKERVVYGN